MRQVASREVYRNRWMSVREDRVRRDDGVEGVYSVVDKPVAACVVPFENDGFHLVEQFRYPIGRRSWEFVQGTWPADGPPGEELARAELAEETGFRAGTLTHLGRIAIAPGMSSQHSDVFLATDLVPGETAREEFEQDMEQRWVPRGEFAAMIGDGSIVDGVTLAAYTLFVLRKE